MSVNDLTSHSLVSALGTRLGYRFLAKSQHPLLAGVRAAWQHELADVQNSLTAQFAEAPAAGSFAVQGTPRSRNSAALGLDGRLPLSSCLDAVADYSLTLGSGQSQQAVYGGLSYKW